MTVAEYIKKMQIIQKGLQVFLDDGENIEENFIHLINIFDNQKFSMNKYEFKSFLYLIAKISNNQHQGTNFFDKVKKIFLKIAKEISSNFSNIELFQIFQKNKKILLFLIENHIISFDYEIASKLTNKKFTNADYDIYFFPEIKTFLTQESIQTILSEIPENFIEKRKNGEEDYLCQIIQKDLIDDFIAYLNKTNLNVNSNVNITIYETNPFLIFHINNENQLTLIEYSAFFGSIKIFKYLQINQADMNSSLWIYAIHGRNPEIIHLLEEINIKPDDKNYHNCLKESIKCHHDEITDYIINNFCNEQDLSSFILHQSLKYYNFNYIKEDSIQQSSLNDLCHYDYFNLVKFFLNSTNINSTYEIMLNKGIYVIFIVLNTI